MYVDGEVTSKLAYRLDAVSLVSAVRIRLGLRVIDVFGLMDEKVLLSVCRGCATLCIHSARPHLQQLRYIDFTVIQLQLLLLGL
jgi:hypothetical protein